MHGNEKEEGSRAKSTHAVHENQKEEWWRAKHEKEPCMSEKVGSRVAQEVKEEERERERERENKQNSIGAEGCHYGEE